MAEENDVLVTRTNRVEIDWPQLVGYYGGIGLALAAEILDPPLAIFIGAIPIIKLLKRKGASFPTRLVTQVIEGAAVPVGGEAQSAVRILSPEESQQRAEQRNQQSQKQRGEPAPA
jgi:hypothetical protein